MVELLGKRWDSEQVVQELPERFPGERVKVTQERIKTFTDGHRRPSMDSRRRRAGKGREPVRWTDCARLPDLVAARPYVVAGVTRDRFSDGSELRDQQRTCPVPIGSKVRLTATLVKVEQIKGGYQPVVSVVIERAGSDKPICVAEPVFRFLS